MSTGPQVAKIRSECAWLAGLYEGEGCLVRRVDRRSGAISWELSISGTDADVIERAHTLTGVGSTNSVRRQRERGQGAYRWHVASRDEIAFVVGLILPHLGRRRSVQAQAFLQWYLAKPSTTLVAGTPSTQRGTST